MYKGILFLLASALTFSLSTVCVKLVTANSGVYSIELAFFRFISGLAVLTIYILYKRKGMLPRNKKFILLRAFFNTIAVIFFFSGLQYSTISKANLLNMTYPVFVFMIAPFINREQTPTIYFIYLIMTMMGIYFTVIPGWSSIGFSSINKGDIYALLSGVTAGFAITSLREARKYDDSYLILFYLMLFGSAVSLAMALPAFSMPHGIIILYILGVALFSLMGQVFITIGYKYISASGGSLASSSRIVFSILLGAGIFSEPITIRIVIGGMLILLSLAGVSGIWKGGGKRKVR